MGVGRGKKNSLDTRRLNNNVTKKKIGPIQKQKIRIVLYFSTLTTFRRFLKQSITKPNREIKPTTTIAIRHAIPTNNTTIPSPPTGTWDSTTASHQKLTIIDVTKSKTPIFVKIQDRFNFGNSVLLSIYFSSPPVHMRQRLFVATLF